MCLGEVAILFEGPRVQFALLIVPVFNALANPHQLLLVVTGSDLSQCLFQSKPFVIFYRLCVCVRGAIVNFTLVTRVVCRQRGRAVRLLIDGLNREEIDQIELAS